MTESEWQEIESIVSKTTIQTVQGIFESEETAELEKSQAMRLEKKAARKKELLEIAGLIRKGMEQYRTEPPEGTIRPVIDWLLRRHRKISTTMDIYTHVTEEKAQSVMEELAGKIKIC